VATGLHLLFLFFAPKIAINNDQLSASLIQKNDIKVTIVTNDKVQNLARSAAAHDRDQKNSVRAESYNGNPRERRQKTTSFRSKN